LPAADTERVTAQLVSIFDISPEDVIHISAKTGFGVQSVIDAIISRIPAPTGSEALPLRARLFDSSYVKIVHRALVHHSVSLPAMTDSEASYPFSVYTMVC
jgi:translation elongation factor EF-4